MVDLWENIKRDLYQEAADIDKHAKHLKGIRADGIYRAFEQMAASFSRRASSWRRSRSCSRDEEAEQRRGQGQLRYIHNQVTYADINLIADSEVIT